jgi:hypothetical protein
MSEGRGLRTIGDLRRHLLEEGQPWALRADWADLDDDQPIPLVGTGGDQTSVDPIDLRTEDDIKNLLRGRAPSNPLLQEVWRENGLDDLDLPAGDDSREEG